MSERKNPDEELPSGRADGEHLASTTALSSSPQLLAVANAAIEAARTFPNGITASEGLARSRGNGIRDATASAALLDRMLVVGGESNGGSGGPGNGISYSHGDRSKRPSTVPAKGTPSTRIHVPRSSCDEAGEESLSAKEKLAFQSLASIDPKRRVLLSDEERAIKRQRRYAQSIAALFSRSLSRSHSCVCYCAITHHRLLQNRQSAALSRSRKKDYLSNLEKDNAELRDENTKLRESLQARDAHIRDLQAQIDTSPHTPGHEAASSGAGASSSSSASLSK